MSTEKKKKNTRFGSSAPAKELAVKLREIKDKKMYPYGYAKKVQAIYNESLKEGEKEITSDYVHQVSGAYIYNERVIDILFKLASENKISQQIKKANDLLS